MKRLVWSMEKRIVKMLSVLCVLLLTVTTVLGCGAKKEEKAAGKTRIAFVTSQAVDQAEWLQNLVKGFGVYQKDNTNVEIKVVEATLTNEYEPKIRALAGDGYDVIITAFDNMVAATLSVAKDYPNIKFGSMDGGIKDLKNYKNIQEFGLNRTETAYLAGMVAGASTKTNKVCMVAGADVGPINEIIAGWQQGLRAVNPKIEDIVTYANTFADPTKGKELGLSLFGKGCDVLGAAAGGTGVGAAQAAAATKNLFVAWDVHYQDVLGNLELGSAVNFFEKMVLQFIGDSISGKYTPGVRTVYGISTGACNFEFLDNSPANAQIKADVEAAKAKIGKGEIKIALEPLHK